MKVTKRSFNDEILGKMTFQKPAAPASPLDLLVMQNWPAYLRNEADYYKRKQLVAVMLGAAARIEMLERIINRYVDPYQCTSEVAEEVDNIAKRLSA